MRQRLWLLLLLLAVPAIAFGVSTAVQAHFDAELRTALRNQIPDADPEKVAAATVDKLCADQPTGTFAEICEMNAHLNLMRRAAISAAIIAIALLIVIGVAGKLAQTNRLLLVQVFRPGLYLTVVVLVGLVLTHAALAIASIYYGEAALTGSIHAGLIATIGIGAGLGIVAMIRSSFSVVKKAQVMVIGRAVSRSETPELWTRVDSAARTLQALPPDQIVLGLDPNFFVTEANVTCLSGDLTGRTLYCSMPLSRILTETELDAIVGHELAHFKGDDTRFSERFYPIYRGTAQSLQSLNEVGSSGGRAIPLLPAVATLSFFYESFAVAESRLSRERELAADAAGASLTSASALASALVKIHAFTGVWNGFDEAAASALKEGKAYANASMLFATAVADNASPSAFEGLVENHLLHPTDSHPTLGVRLQALKHELPEMTTAALQVSPSASALGATEIILPIEEEVTGVYQAILAHRLGIQIDDGAEAAVATANV